MRESGAVALLATHAGEFGARGSEITLVKGFRGGKKGLGVALDDKLSGREVVT